MSYYMCNYPGCNDGRCVGKKFCHKHLQTPFETRAEVNAYRRGLHVARKSERAHAAAYIRDVGEDQVLDLIREEELWLERQPFLQAIASGAFAPYQVKR